VLFDKFRKCGDLGDDYHEHYDARGSGMSPFTLAAVDEMEKEQQFDALPDFKNALQN
jgi:hypothetical protein